MELKKQ